MKHNACNFTRPRRGTAYLLIVSMLGLLVISGVSASLISQLRTRSASLAADMQRADVLAESALARALALINSTPTWRTTFLNNVEGPQVSFGGGMISWKAVDENDGNLANNATQSVRLYGYGRFGRSTRVVSVLVSGSGALPIMSNAMTVGGAIVLDTTVLNAPSRAIHTNGSFTGGNASTRINANLLTSGTITPNGCTITGTQAAAAPLASLPDNNAFGFYLANGTAIPWSKVGGKIEKRTISPNSSSYSFVDNNPLGIYIIDCGGNKLEIYNSRIVGTLVILNPGPGSRVGGGSNEDAVHWTPGTPGLPCLLVRGDMAIGFNKAANTVLSEANLSTNFNGTNHPFPFSGGTTDSDTLDTYPSVIDGLVYVSGSLTVDSVSFSRIDNLIVGGAYNVKRDTVTLEYNPSYAATPPPGFTGSGAMQPVQGTWRWEAQ
jgi:hypothetical protein